MKAAIRLLPANGIAASEASDQASELLAMIVHELRGPLSATLSWMHLLREGKLDQATSSRAFESIEHSLLYQQRLINDLLDISKIDLGKLHLERRAVDLVLITECVVDSIRARAATRSIQLSAQLEHQRCMVMADAGRIQQVLWNLLDNAIKFTPPKGSIEIRLSHNDSAAQILIVDTGMGINPEFLPQIFQPFAQEKAIGGQAGSGLGLAIVKELVERHGGSIRAENNPNGRGARFVLRLPVLRTSTILKEHTNDRRLRGARTTSASRLCQTVQ